MRTFEITAKITGRAHTIVLAETEEEAVKKFWEGILEHEHIIEWEYDSINDIHDEGEE